MPNRGDMQALGAFINDYFPGTGWCVFTWDIDQHAGGMGNYISNGNREDMIKALRELADKLERGNIFPTPESN